jgi:hypothetical protein
MSLLSNIIIKAFEAELANKGPEIEAYVVEVLGKLGAELMAYVSQKQLTINPPQVPVQTPQSVE